MKKISLYLLVIVLGFSACKKTDSSCGYSDSTKVATSAEISYIQSYLTTNTLTATQHSSGFFYSISAAGTGQVNNLCANVTVRYVGKLFNGTTFDSNTTGVGFTLGQLIVGWQKGIPLVGKGGAIRLYVPPSLGYGASAVGPIPANSYLMFDINVDNIAN